MCCDYAVSSLMNIIVKGTPKQRNRIVGTGGITTLIDCLESSKDSVVIAAVRSLGKLATGSSKNHREKVITTKTIPRFIELLDSDHDVCIESSLSLLVAAAKTHDIGCAINLWMCDKSLLPPLTRILKLPSQLHMLPECSTLLVNVVDFGQPPVQDVIDSAVLSTVIDVMSTNDDPTVQTNLAHVLIKLATSDQTGVIAKVEGLLPILVTLLDSSNDVIANESIVALGNIVQIAPEYRNLVVEAGVMTPLLYIMKHSETFHKLIDGAEILFQLLHSRESQRDDNLSHVSVHHLVEAQKKRRLDSTIEKVNVTNLGCFIASRVFAGNIKGYMYKTGSSGLGYYRDG